MEAFISRIGIPSFIQMTIECWNGLFLLIMIVMMLISRQPTETSKKYNVRIPMTNEILVFYIAIFLYNLFDVISSVVLGDTTGGGFLWYAVSVFCYFLTGAFQTLFFLQLVKKQIAGRNGMKWLQYLTAAVQCLHIPCIILLAVTPFTNALYWFDDLNHYHRGDLYWVWYYATLISFVYIIALIFIFRRKADPFFIRIAVVSSILPTIAFVLNFVYSGISFNNISVSVTALIIFIMHEKLRSDMLISGVKETETVRRELAEKKAELEQSKNKVLMAQIKPHFIYNSLTAIRATLDEPKKARELINHFSRFLRGSIDVLEETECIRAERELETVDHYLFMEKERFGDDLTIIKDIRDEGFMIPAFAIQTLAENAVNHGVRESEDGIGTVTIRTFLTGSEHIVEVSDDGVGFLTEADIQKKDDRNHIGLSNLRERLELMCGGKLEIESEPGRGTLARIRIPINGEKEGSGNENTDS